MVSWGRVGSVSNKTNIRSAGEEHTGTVGNNSALFHFFPAFLQQSQQGVECTSGLEGADTLIVLTLEEESDARVCGGLAFKWSSDERLRSLRR